MGVGVDKLFGESYDIIVVVYVIGRCYCAAVCSADGHVCFHKSVTTFALSAGNMYEWTEWRTDLLDHINGV